MTIFTFLLLALFAAPLDGSDTFFDRTDAFLNKYVENGKVDYAGIDRSEIGALLDEIANYPVSSVSKSEQLAFYLNAYNVLTINNVLKHQPISSPMDVEGFFDAIAHNVAGKQLTLNGIENDVIRPTFNDARIHFAVVCGAIGCPPIASEAFMPESVDRQLEQRTRYAMNQQSFTRIDNNQSKVGISQIFKWYVEDFGGNLEGVKTFINRYVNNPIPNSFEWSHYEYDWTLNAQ